MIIWRFPIYFSLSNVFMMKTILIDQIIVVFSRKGSKSNRAIAVHRPGRRMIRWKMHIHFSVQLFTRRDHYLNTV